MIEPEDLEPRRIELDTGLFGKVGAEMSYIQSQMQSDYDSAESIADSDLEDGELRKMAASPLYIQGRRGIMNHFENHQLQGN